jgi:phenylpropionate dioxygenase-like ring-hydroxylating dioxygenase large terminal subunit
MQQGNNSRPSEDGSAGQHPMFMNNAWYASAWSHELSGALLGRRICGRPVVLYRIEDGTPAALEDLCCHRLLPLSRGRLEGDLLVCGYHGLTFDRSGQCVRIPSQKAPGRQVRVRSYPVIERHRLIWIWVGDPALADPALVPDLHWNDDPGWTFTGDLLPMACDYRLVIDNLLDLTHETWVHQTTIGHSLIPACPIETVADDSGVTVSRWILDHDPAPFWRYLMKRAREYEGRCDRWQVVKFVPPCNVVLHIGVAEAGSGATRGDLGKGLSAMQLNSITPASASSCWYFWSFTRNFLHRDEQLSAELLTTSRRIFGEDQVIIEAQQRVMLENSGASTININLDAASVRMRQMIEARSAREAGVAGVRAG